MISFPQFSLFTSLFRNSSAKSTFCAAVFSAVLNQVFLKLEPSDLSAVASTSRKASTNAAKGALSVKKESGVRFADDVRDNERLTELEQVFTKAVVPSWNSERWYS